MSPRALGRALPAQAGVRLACGASLMPSSRVIAFSRASPSLRIQLHEGCARPSVGLCPLSAACVLPRFTFHQAPRGKWGSHGGWRSLSWKASPNHMGPPRFAGVPGVKGCLVPVEGWAWPPAATWGSAVSHSLTCSVSGLFFEQKDWGTLTLKVSV